MVYHLMYLSFRILNESLTLVIQCKVIRMDIQSIKVDLIHWLTELQDRSILEKLQAFKKQQEATLSDAHKTLLDERIVSYEKDPDNVLDWDHIIEEFDKDQ